MSGTEVGQVVVVNGCLWPGRCSIRCCRTTPLGQSLQYTHVRRLALSSETFHHRLKTYLTVRCTSAWLLLLGACLLTYLICLTGWRRHCERTSQQWWSLETRVSSRDCLETWFFMSRSWLSLDTCMSRLGSVSRISMSRHVSCLVTGSWPVSMCLFFAEPLASLDPFSRCLLTYCETIVLCGGCFMDI